jgi:hypothetical protein
VTIAPDPTFTPVASPPAQIPAVGLIASLSGPNLIDDSGDNSAPGSEMPDGTPLTTRWENRWELGYSYLPEQQCRAAGVLDPCGVQPKTVPPAEAIVSEMPFVVWAGDHCSSFGWQAHDFKGRAQRALLAVESYQIAREFWTGTQAQASAWPNFFLTGPETYTLGGGPQSSAAALALLEQALAETSLGQPGMIHCTRQVASALSELGNTFRSVNGLIVTYMGNIICPDAGYPGTGPGGAATAGGNQWAYATLMPTVRRSPIVLLPDTWEEVLDRRTNTVDWRAERLAGVTVPPCTAVAVEIALPLAVVVGS